MPNGGSDCCGTCWFNEKNKGEEGYAHAKDAEADFCTIRGFAIRMPFYTYCGNHPHRRPEKDPVPIGPVYVGNSSGEREIFLPSPDTEEIRLHLLDLLQQIPDRPPLEYPMGLYLNELVVWQLGEFHETRSVAHLRRIAALSAASEDPFGRTQHRLVMLAREGLSKIEGQAG